MREIEQKGGRTAGLFPFPFALEKKLEGPKVYCFVLAV